MINTIELFGKKYPARYSLRAAINVGDKYGSVRSALLSGEDNQGEDLRRRSFVLMELLKAGKVWSESEEGEHSPELPTEEDLLDRTTFQDWQNILLLMLKIINEDDQTDFEAEATGKNVEATPDQ